MAEQEVQREWWRVACFSIPAIMRLTVREEPYSIDQWTAEDRKSVV